MDVEISPEPDESEREAILAALADDQAEVEALSPWVQAVLPERGGEDEGP